MNRCLSWQWVAHLTPLCLCPADRQGLKLANETRKQNDVLGQIDNGLQELLEGAKASHQSQQGTVCVQGGGNLLESPEAA